MVNYFMLNLIVSLSGHKFLFNEVKLHCPKIQTFKGRIQDFTKRGIDLMRTEFASTRVEGTKPRLEEKLEIRHLNSIF